MAIVLDSQPKSMLLPPDCDRLAAHIFVRWWLGHCAYRVELVDRPSKAAEIDGPGIMHLDPAYLIGCEDPEIVTFIRAAASKRAEQMLLIVAAGSSVVATGSGAGSGPLEALDGRDAVRTLKRVTDWIGGDADRNWSIAVERARLLLDAPRARRAVDGIAKLLAAKLWLEHDEMDDICASWFGGRRPFHDAWAEAWPPTSEQLRQAYVPRYREDDAAVMAMVAPLNSAAACLKPAV